MFAQLGDIRFEVMHFSGLSGKRGAAFAEHEKADGKPRLQRMGLNLETLEMQLVFDYRFGSPTRQIKELRKLQESQSPAVLLFGSGEVRGEFVVSSLSEDVVDTDHLGGILRMEVSVELTESTDPDRKAVQARIAKAQAKALKSPAHSVKTLSAAALKASPVKQTEAAITAAKGVDGANKALALARLIGQAAADPSKMDVIAKKAVKLDASLAPVEAAVTSGKPIYSAVAGSASTIRRLRQLSTAVQANIQGGDLPSLNSNGKEIESLQRKIRRELLPLSALVATRRA